MGRCRYAPPKLTWGARHRAAQPRGEVAPKVCGLGRPAKVARDEGRLHGHGAALRERLKGHKGRLQAKHCGQNQRGEGVPPS